MVPAVKRTWERDGVGPRGREAVVAWWASDLPLRLLTTPPSNRPIDATTYSHIYVPGRVAELVPKHHRTLVLGCVGHSHSDARAHEKVWNVGDHAEEEGHRKYVKCDLGSACEEI
mmetsp:Transcript_61578/g.169267  ORF Transcript_61578/g.169267 Transcript_61578/m.169267 type:complete len:115 (+) Transcript_61578:356-700(+)